MENYRRAPKLYHVGSKAATNNESVSIIPKHIYDAIFNSIDGKCGNQIKLILTLLGTIGDGSFGVSEAWILKSCGFSHTSYIRARKELVKMGWVTLTKGNLSVIINNILTYRDDTIKIKPPQKTHDESLECRDERNQTHEDTNETTRDVSCNKEEYINNKEYNKRHDDTNNLDEVIKEINFSRTIDLKVLLRTVKETEHLIKSFIISNNIDSADDFIYFWNKLNEEDSVFMEKSTPKNKFTVLEKYNKYLDCNKEINEGNILENTDIIYAGNEDKQEEINNIFFSTNPFSCVLSLDQAEILKQLQADGILVSKYFFRRNDKAK